MQNTQMTQIVNVTFGALMKSKKYYNCKVSDILQELLLSSLSAEATNITVNIYDNRIVISDDGNPINNPEDILHYGRYNFVKELPLDDIRTQIGFFALSGRAGTILSYNSETKDCWSTRYTPDHFNGNKPFLIKNETNTYLETVISFKLSPFDTENHIDTIKRITRYYPIKVTVHDKSTSNTESFTSEPEDFLEKAIKIIKTEFGRIGIYDNINDTPPTSINHNGILNSFHFPLRGKYLAAIDITNPEWISFTLPERKSFIIDDNWKTILNQIIYELYIKISEDETHSLPHREYIEAGLLGISLKESQPRLKKWRPKTANHYDDFNDIYVDIEDLTRAIIIDEATSTTQDQFIRHALNNNQDCQIDLYLADDNSKDYNWYNNVPTVEDISIDIIKADKEARVICQNRRIALIRDYETSDHLWINDFKDPDRIILYLNLSNKNELTFDADFIIFGEGYLVSHLDILFITNSAAKYDEDDLLEIIKEAYYQPSDEYDADSHATQQEHFRNNALKSIYYHINPSMVDIENFIKDLFEQYVQNYIPKNHSVTITSLDRNIAIEVTNSAEQQSPDETDLQTENIFIKIEGHECRVKTEIDPDGFTIKVKPKGDNPKMSASGFTRVPYIINVFKIGENLSYNWRGMEAGVTEYHRICMKIWNLWLDHNPKLKSKIKN